MSLQQEIIDNAIELFKEKDLKFTMDDIAEKMHISKKTIYKEFTSKEALFSALADYAFQTIYALKQEIASKELPLEEKLFAVMVAMPEKFENIDFSKLRGLKDIYPETYQKVESYLDNGWEPVFQIYQEGVKEGIFRSIDLAIFKETYLATIDRFMYTDILEKQHLSYHEALNKLMDILMLGIKEEK